MVCKLNSDPSNLVIFFVFPPSSFLFQDGQEVLLENDSLMPCLFKQIHEATEGFKPKQQHPKEQTNELSFHMDASSY